ncbi:putative small nuclear ribonucleoprotein F [Histomonas meleagridis]|uniref:putative small nuclear ribonucleoprotein F n=1 Tax=Histomonas meleagridis TaxID=135588 RepID=UPI0035598133|nr:putative small nuclear ribonucleoprotein F [Histomonas meleagridis]KAH0796767.1 putative small nuclear ribonucleoprotein F [Histomonas meleagridis]
MSGATTTYLHPAPFLSSMINHEIVVRLKWGIEYVGTLVSFDTRMNIHLRDCQEYIKGKLDSSTPIGDLLIRCNNILHIRVKPQNYPNEPIPDDAVFDDDEE